MNKNENREKGAAQARGGGEDGTEDEGAVNGFGGFFCREVRFGRVSQNGCFVLTGEIIPKIFMLSCG